VPILADRIEVQHGATVSVTVMQSPDYVAALKRAGRPFASPMAVLGILDTGASCSALDSRIVRLMSLQHRGVAEIHTPSTGAGVVHKGVYDATLALGETTGRPISATVPVIECEFASRGFLALIGRDLLNLCILTYDGPTGRFQLEWPD